ncbi:MAG: lamin tail domain-containing protein [Halobacteriota archaeon]
MGTRLLTVAVVLALLVAGCTTGLDGVTTSPTPGAGSDTATPGAQFETSNGTVEVHFINVKQGDSTLVVGPTGETLLVDTGDYRDDGQTVLSYLTARNVTRIDALVTTHADADHIGGHAKIIEHYETRGEGIGAVYDTGIVSGSQTYAEYLDAVEAYDVALYQTYAGDSISIDGVDVSVLGPPESALDGGDRNENSIVLLLTYGETTVLLPGDAEDDEESYLVDHYEEIRDVTVLKAGHHGSRSSSGEAFLAATEPQVAVISSDYDSQYGHPHEEALHRLADASVETYWTGVHGSVVAVSDGETVTMFTQANATTDPMRLYAASPIPPDSTAPQVARATYNADGSRRGSPESAETSITPSPGVDDESSGIEITEIHADAAGDDRENLNDEYVTIANTGDGRVDLAGWTVRDEAGKTYEFPDGVVLGPGESVTLRTGDGTDGGGDVYWDAESPVWNNDGDTVTVVATDGDIVTTEAY